MVSPALHHEGADRLQMVGIGSLHVQDSFHRTVSSSYGGYQHFYTVKRCTPSGLRMIRKSRIRASLPGCKEELRGWSKKEGQRSSSVVGS